MAGWSMAVTLSNFFKIRPVRFPTPIEDVLAAAQVQVAASGAFDPAHILSYLKGKAADGASSDQDLYVSSTKLVELRNPLPDGSLRPPPYLELSTLGVRIRAFFAAKVCVRGHLLNFCERARVMRARIRFRRVG